MIATPTARQRTKTRRKSNSKNDDCFLFLADFMDYNFAGICGSGYLLLFLN